MDQINVAAFYWVSARRTFSFIRSTPRAEAWLAVKSGVEEAEEKKAQEEHEVLVAGVEKIQLQEEQSKEEEKKHGHVETLNRCHSTSSSSSSDEEVEVEGEGGIKEKIKKKKKELKEKIEKKLHGGEKKTEEEEKKEAVVVEDTTVVVEKVEVSEAEPPVEEEKKGFLEKIKEKLPGSHAKKPVEEGLGVTPPHDSPAPVAVEVTSEHVKVQEVEGHEGKEKKGFLGKIIEKLPGYHRSAGEEGEKSPASH
ncbi:hypothetical protein HPP92_020312 [Vanilla planifolia]|uniref:Dehydrin n=1 Tax=Vanilla planifolia TaxID=51239 RepID=A0A835Q0G5_VANPL|nr:hypothetical protein HPP92_020312 [Vanilla planifolia]